ncbi:putative nucleoredoxin 2 [Forsythia ovata]|uniref:protein-disulfide reductase n=1 Tax=Forsythia ovata TaxID=205694 RepID=A0ABD1PWB8_9LAMI
MSSLVRISKLARAARFIVFLITTHERIFPWFLFQAPVASLTGKTVGLFFSAQWCLPGVKFTPKLVSIYRKIKQELAVKGGEDFDIVFVSSDYDQTTFDSYFQTMPWLALPFGDPAIKNLAKYFDIRGIPSLVILGPGRKNCHQARKEPHKPIPRKCIPIYRSQNKIAGEASG